MSFDYLIVGLGNPGNKHKKTFHNLGFETLDTILEDYEAPAFSFSKIFNADISKGIINGKDILFAKPLTFMNLSGESVAKIIKKHKISHEKMIVIHDDLDIAMGKVKVSQNRGSAGHKGVDSIINNLKTKNFIRVRIGIAPEKGKPKDVDKFVLCKVSDETLRKLAKTTAETIAGIL